MEEAVKIWDAEDKNGDPTIAPVIELLNNIKFLAAAYNQMWVIKKMIIVNPDPLMQEAIDEIVRRGWFSVKEEYLLTTEPHFEEARVVLTEAEDAPGLSEAYIEQ